MLARPHLLSFDNFYSNYEQYHKTYGKGNDPVFTVCANELIVMQIDTPPVPSWGGVKDFFRPVKKRLAG